MIFDGSVHSRGKNTSVKSQDLSRQWESIQIWVSIVFSCVRYWIFFNGDWPRLFLLRSWVNWLHICTKKATNPHHEGFRVGYFLGVHHVVTLFAWIQINLIYVLPKKRLASLNIQGNHAFHRQEHGYGVYPGKPTWNPKNGASEDDFSFQLKDSEVQVQQCHFLWV